MSEQSKIWRAVSVGLFVLCLIMPAYNAEGTNYYGWFLLLLGIYGLPSGELSWLANIALLISWLTLPVSSRALPLAFALGAIILALSFAQRDTVWVYNWDDGEAQFKLQLGYYTWLTSMAVAALATFTISKKEAGTSPD